VSLVHNVNVAGPATHAFLIGVGFYPHLNGGGQTLTSDNDGMGQLTSPPVSARALAQWLITSFRNPSKPLSTVELLLSEAAPAPFDHPAQGPVAVNAATMANVVPALGDWFVRGNAHPDNLLLFYFCGHGISQGPNTALLMADFGANPLRSLSGALDFRKLYLGLERCRATEQCFFIDACRASSDTLISAEGAGQDPIQPGVRDPSWPRRRTSVSYATLKGAKAFGVPDRPSAYTSALLSALNDFAFDDEEGDWRVSTHGLAGALDHLVTRQMARDHQLAQVPESNDRSKFYLHYGNGLPDALLYILCNPPEARPQVQLTYQSPGAGPTTVPLPNDGETEWHLRLPTGSYEFVASFPPGTFKNVTRSQHVHPVYRTLKLEVQP
jgi:Caspase domain